ncbi:sulfurtransferase TusA family protein [Sulfurirhabdus autotrophica]|uniref:tRNA 2-thiouridine synthesizing protein A n=1 Tax=Sulfurirhabdus autotrophica TaxID=1706046 RepID=A0A4R3YET1_9PROT|nr:sulfurtransferase TusA family protein [Sulfurirhabdus autotrophica]TCV90616.1 tRNA 2-thiouridine synthesizing protein A [Sulfurirhabdus autotrophica]
MSHDHFIDIKNMCCAAPIVLLTKSIKLFKSGDVVLIESNKVSMVNDISAYCKMTQHLLIKHEEISGLHHFWIQIK